MAEKYPMITSPRGVFIYPHLTTPDTKFVKPDGEYHTKFALVADETETDEFIAGLQEVLDAYIEENPDELKPGVIKKAARADFFEEELDEEGEETGRLIFKFKLKAKVKTKTKEWDQQPRLFDSAANPITGDVNIWTGSEGKASLELFPYFMQTSKTFGVSLRIKAAQILKLVEGSGPGADKFGFGAEDDGYTSDASDAGFSDESDGEDDDEF